jgi:hypothetical protein
MVLPSGSAGRAESRAGQALELAAEVLLQTSARRTA